MNTRVPCDNLPIDLRDYCNEDTLQIQWKEGSTQAGGGNTTQPELASRIRLSFGEQTDHLLLRYN
jgi:hypothetical protein